MLRLAIQDDPKPSLDLPKRLQRRDGRNRSAHGPMHGYLDRSGTGAVLALAPSLPVEWPPPTETKVVRDGNGRRTSPCARYLVPYPEMRFPKYCPPTLTAASETGGTRVLPRLSIVQRCRPKNILWPALGSREAKRRDVDHRASSLRPRNPKRQDILWFPFV